MSNLYEKSNAMLMKLFHPSSDSDEQKVGARNPDPFYFLSSSTVQTLCDFENHYKLNYLHHSTTPNKAILNTFEDQFWNLGALMSQPIKRMSNLFKPSSPNVEDGANHQTQHPSSPNGNELNNDSGALIVCYDDEPVSTVLETLSVYKISSCPVIRRSNEEVLGFIDILDVVAFCSMKFDTRVHFLPAHLDLNRVSERRSEEFLNTNIQHVLTLSGRNVWMETPSSTSVLELIQTIATKKKIRRIAIVLEENNLVPSDSVDNTDIKVKTIRKMKRKVTKKVTGVVTQSQLTRFLYNNREELLPFLTMKVSQIKKDVPQQVECVQHNDLVIVAFKRIWEKEVAAVAVVDKEGKLIGTISASDIKSVDFYTHSSPDPRGTPSFHPLYSSTSQFINVIQSHRNFSYEYEHPVVVVNPDDNLNRVLELLVTYHIHRVFVIDEHKKPVDVISLRDVLSVFTKKT